MSMEPAIAARNEEIVDLKRQSASLVAGLKTCLSNSFVLMMKTQACHWNVTGPLFASVHEMTQLQYEDMFTAIDEIAERIRSLGHPAPSSLADMIREATIEEQAASQRAEVMVAALERDHRTVAEQMRLVVRSAENASDAVTADLLTARIAFHEKTAWMLGALVSE